MKLRILLFWSVFWVMCGTSGAAPVVGSERTRNLQGLERSPMLMEYHRQTVGEDRQFFTYPRRDYGFIRNFTRTESGAMMFMADTTGEFFGKNHSFGVAASPVFGAEYRGSESLGDTLWPSFDGGIYLRGYADSLDFDLDARMYAGEHSAKKPKSFDGEVFDVQTKEGNAGADYVSYSRYRAHMALNYAWARLQLARDVLHWGPGYYNNLSLNQFALPYNMLSLDLTFGPLRVFSVYADLRVDSWSYSRNNLNDRNLYAHRYELAIGNMTIGMSEIQVLYNENKPWLFVPIAPLFIEKGNYTERVNNGALALDMNYRLFSAVRLYGEFFLDDLESPNAVYENKYSNNRWAGMLGLQAGHDFYIGQKRLSAGTIAEIARVEPYTYCHYDTAHAQLANLGAPLGNPNGPNSLAVDWTVYAQAALGSLGQLFAGVHQKWLWKGTDAGSNIEDPYKTVRKRFAHGAPLVYTVAPAIGYNGRFVGFSGELTLGDVRAADVRISFMW